MPTLDRARAIASSVHRHQRDLAGRPYLAHVYRVMRAVPGRLKVAAALHDVIEDGEDWTLDRLRAEGFDAATVATVDALTKRRGETYAGYILRLSADADAVTVKLADLADNLDPRRPISESLRRRYEEARRLLLSIGSLRSRK